MGAFCSCKLDEAEEWQRRFGATPEPPTLPTLPALVRIEYCAASNYVVQFLRLKARLEQTFPPDQVRVIEAADITLASRCVPVGTIGPGQHAVRFARGSITARAFICWGARTVVTDCADHRRPSPSGKFEVVMINAPPPERVLHSRLLLQNDLPPGATHAPPTAGGACETDAEQSALIGRLRHYIDARRPPASTDNHNNNDR